jgi:restriction endonuclease S subunit
LEGQKIAEVTISKVNKNKDYRIDSEFHTSIPKYNPKLVYDKIKNLLKNAQYGISVSMNEDEVGFPIYRMNEIHNMLCDLDVNKYADINKSEFQRFKLNDRDVLFNRTNSYEWVGRTGIYRKNGDRDFTFASYLVRFVPIESKILPEYLSAFLNTKYGINDIKRRARQSINQTNVNPEEVKEIEIPILSHCFQNLIKECFDKANNQRIISKNKYKQAENILIEAIGLKDFNVNKKAVNIKNYSDSFVNSGRLDAEYYQPKYSDYLKLLKGYNNGFAKVGSICSIKDKNFNPKEKIKYKYIELANIGKTGEIKDCIYKLGSELPTRARRKVSKNDVIISSIEGSLDSCALITSEYDNSLCSTGFYVINSETLLVLFKSEPIQNLLKKGCSGTILTAISKNELEEIPLPLIEDNLQRVIKLKINESFSLRKESENLLELAKKAVEKAIEENEQAAINFLTENIN